MQKKCEYCRRTFTPRTCVPNQKYCSNHKCQKARRHLWRRRKLASDPDYKANQADAQKRWRRKNQDYWKQYRQSHPNYADRNRKLQERRNRRRNGNKHLQLACETIAKSDVTAGTKPVPSGFYKLVPIKPDMIAKSDELIVQLTVIMRTR